MCKKNRLHLFILQKPLWNLTLVILRVKPRWIAWWWVGTSSLWTWAYLVSFGNITCGPVCWETAHSILSGVLAPHQDATRKPSWSPLCQTFCTPPFSSCSSSLWRVGHWWVQLSLHLHVIVLLPLNTLHPFAFFANPQTLCAYKETARYSCQWLLLSSRPHALSVQWSTNSL